jgi:hypothetical protein
MSLERMFVQASRFLVRAVLHPLADDELISTSRQKRGFKE